MVQFTAGSRPVLVMSTPRPRVPRTEGTWSGLMGRLGLGLGLGFELGCELGLGLASGSGSGMGLGLGLGSEGAHRSRRGSALEAMVAPWLGLGLGLTVRVRAYG